MTFTKKLAKHVASITSISENEADKIKRAILDRLGCALYTRRIGIGNDLIETFKEES